MKEDFKTGKIYDICDIWMSVDVRLLKVNDA